MANLYVIPCIAEEEDGELKTIMLMITAWDEAEAESRAQEFYEGFTGMEYLYGFEKPCDVTDFVLSKLEELSELEIAKGGFSVRDNKVIQ